MTTGILKQSLRGDAILSVAPKLPPLRPSIEALLALCGPSAIIGRVRTVVVDAINRVCVGWFIAHVCKEGHERVTPPIADINATAAIVSEGLVAVVFAPHFHGDPSPVFRGINTLSMLAALPMLSEGDANALESKTATRNNKPLCKVARADINLSSTIAPTTPVRIATARWQFRQGHQPSKSNAGMVALSSHSLNYSAMVLVP